MTPPIEHPVPAEHKTRPGWLASKPNYLSRKDEGSWVVIYVEGEGLSVHCEEHDARVHRSMYEFAVLDALTPWAFCDGCRDRQNLIYETARRAAEGG